MKYKRLMVIMLIGILSIWSYGSTLMLTFFVEHTFNYLTEIIGRDAYQVFLGVFASIVLVFVSGMIAACVMHIAEIWEKEDKNER